MDVCRILMNMSPCREVVHRLEEETPKGVASNLHKISPLILLAVHAFPSLGIILHCIVMQGHRLKASLYHQDN